MMSATQMRVPRMHGLPEQMFGSIEIRCSRSSRVMVVQGYGEYNAVVRDHGLIFLASVSSRVTLLTRGTDKSVCATFGPARLHSSANTEGKCGWHRHSCLCP